MSRILVLHKAIALRGSANFPQYKRKHENRGTIKNRTKMAIIARCCFVLLQSFSLKWNFFPLVLIQLNDMIVCVTVFFLFLILFFSIDFVFRIFLIEDA